MVGNSVLEARFETAFLQARYVIKGNGFTNSVIKIGLFDPIVTLGFKKSLTPI